MSEEINEIEKKSTLLRLRSLGQQQQKTFPAEQKRRMQWVMKF